MNVGPNLVGCQYYCKYPRMQSLPFRLNRWWWCQARGNMVTNTWETHFAWWLHPSRTSATSPSWAPYRFLWLWWQCVFQLNGEALHFTRSGTILRGRTINSKVCNSPFCCSTAVVVLKVDRTVAAVMYHLPRCHCLGATSLFLILCVATDLAFFRSIWGENGRGDLRKSPESCEGIQLNTLS